MSERDTHFAGFAKLQWGEMCDGELGEIIAERFSHDDPDAPHEAEMEAFEQAIQAIIARCAYDLVEHSIMEYDSANAEWVKIAIEDRVSDMTTLPKDE